MACAGCERRKAILLQGANARSLVPQFRHQAGATTSTAPTFVEWVVWPAFGLATGLVIGLAASFVVIAILEKLLAVYEGPTLSKGHPYR
jgi:hypothetical protein